MNVQDKILELLEKKPQTLSSLCRTLNLSLEDGNRLLKPLVDSYQISLNDEKEYVVTRMSAYRFGTVEMRYDGSIYVQVEDQVVKVHPRMDMNVSQGDLVQIRLVDYHGLNGLIEKVISKNVKRMTGTVFEKEGIKYVKLDESSNRRIKICLKKEDQSIPIHTKILFTIGAPDYGHYYHADIIKILGKKGDLDLELISKLEREEVPYTFSKEVLKEAQALPKKVLPKDYERRVDLTQEEVFTIDGDGTKDFDDAISCKILENGHYQLGVHIADVSHYVQEGSAIYQEALKRGTSIYFMNRVIPMLPFTLSNGICSLKENENRLTLSVIMELDQQGHCIQSHVVPSVICSKKRMTYAKVNCVLNHHFVEDYEPFKNTLFTMNDLAQILRKKREKSGSISFEQKEPQFSMNEDKVLDMTFHERGEAENLIEEFMIEANKVVATLAFQNAYPFLYRGHRIPERSLMVEVSKFMSKLGISLPYSLEKSYMDPKVFQQTLKWCKSSSYYPIIEEMLLHTMRKAEYYAFPIGHYGLAIDQDEFYTHFTSPIRRFPDLCVHQLIKDFVLGDLFYKNEEVQNRILSLKNKLPFIASVASHAETRALEIERYMEKQTMKKYIQYKIGSTVSGSIVKIEERGITLLIDDLYHILIPSYTIYGYIMDSNQLSFQCPHGVYYLMDELEVKITSVSRTAMVYGVISKENKQRKTPKVYQKD